MKDPFIIHSIVSGLAFSAVFLLTVLGGGAGHGYGAENVVNLPAPKLEGDVSVESALSKRRSVREFTPEPLTLTEVSQLLWAAQGVTSRRGYRTAPSAGALYPLEVYIVAGDVRDLDRGVYKYESGQHRLRRIAEGDRRRELASAALDQSFVGRAPAVIMISAVYERTTRKYRDRGIRYVYMEAGHAAQNIALQAVSLNLGTVMIGAFYENRVVKALNTPEHEEPVYLIPVGKGAS